MPKPSRGTRYARQDRHQRLYAISNGTHSRLNGWKFRTPSSPQLGSAPSDGKHDCVTTRACVHASNSDSHPPEVLGGTVSSRDAAIIFGIVLVARSGSPPIGSSVVREPTRSFVPTSALGHGVELPIVAAGVGTDARLAFLTRRSEQRGEGAIGPPGADRKPFRARRPGAAVPGRVGARKFLTGMAAGFLRWNVKSKGVLESWSCQCSFEPKVRASVGRKVCRTSESDTGVPDCNPRAPSFEGPGSVNQ
jgi:hypothetical protein